jgi:hypothetical protein
MTIPIKPPIELNEEQREVAKEMGLLDILLGNVELARVDVGRYLRVVEGKVQDVEAYHYKREGLPALEVQTKAAPPPLPKMTIGTMLPGEQLIVRSQLTRLLVKYPEVSKQIKKVTAAKFTQRWASFHDEGTMKFNNIGAKYTKQYGEEEAAKYRDPTLTSTVSHEFGHALMQDLAGGHPTDEERKVIKEIDNKFRRGRKKPMYMPRLPEVEKRNQLVRDLNEELHEQQRRTNELIKEVMGRVSEAFDGDAKRLHDQIVAEFAENPSYVLRNQEELFAQAFAHYELGQRGVISDIVGAWVQEKYGKVEP